MLVYRSASLHPANGKLVLWGPVVWIRFGIPENEKIGILRGPIQIPKQRVAPEHQNLPLVDTFSGLIHTACAIKALIICCTKGMNSYPVIYGP